MARWRVSVRVVIVSCVVLLAVSVACVWMGQYFERYNRAADQAAAAGMRETLIDSVKQLNANAVADPKTGDQYLPEAKLYVPYTAAGKGLTYGLYQFTGTTLFNVSSEWLLSHSAAGLYMARDVNELFGALPLLQACQRATLLSFTQLPTDDEELSGQMELYHALRLNNGKDLYIYVNRACPGAKEVAEVLKGLRAY